MASFKQNEYCPECQKTIVSKEGKCPYCRGKAEKGTWSVRFRIIENRSLKNKSLSGYKTKREAQQGYVDFMAEYVPEVAPNEEYDLMFEQLWAKYYDYLKNRVKTSSLYTIEHDYENHIKPFYSGKKINQITKRDVFQWQEELNTKGYKFKYKSKIRGFLSSILKFGVMYYDLPLNPVMQVETFRRVNEAKKEMHVWNKSDFTFFISAVDDIVYKTLFTLMYYTGCRKSEAFALNWSNIDFETKKIHFNKTLTRKVVDKPYEVLTTPKTEKSNRYVIMPKELIQCLIEYKKTISNINKSSFVFGGNIPLSENTVSRKLKSYIAHTNKNQEKNGMPSIPLIHEHEFRHSHASLLISNGASIVLVSKRLGHASVEETLNTYSHLMPNDEEKVIEKLDL